MQRVRFFLIVFMGVLDASASTPAPLLWDSMRDMLYEDIERVSDCDLADLEKACERRKDLFPALIAGQQRRVCELQKFLSEGKDAFVAMCNAEGDGLTEFYSEADLMSELFVTVVKKLHSCADGCLIFEIGPATTYFLQGLSRLCLENFALAKILWQALSLRYAEPVEMLIELDEVFGRIFCQIETALREFSTASVYSKEMIFSCISILPKAKLTEFLTIQHIRFIAAYWFLIKTLAKDDSISNESMRDFIAQANIFCCGRSVLKDIKRIATKILRRGTAGTADDDHGSDDEHDELLKRVFAE